MQGREGKGNSVSRVQFQACCVVTGLVPQIMPDNVPNISRFVGGFKLSFCLAFFCVIFSTDQDRASVDPT